MRAKLRASRSAVPQVPGGAGTEFASSVGRSIGEHRSRLRPIFSSSATSRDGTAFPQGDRRTFFTAAHSRPQRGMGRRNPARLSLRLRSELDGKAWAFKPADMKTPASRLEERGPLASGIPADFVDLSAEGPRDQQIVYFPIEATSLRRILHVDIVRACARRRKLLYESACRLVFGFFRRLHLRRPFFR